MLLHRLGNRRPFALGKSDYDNDFIIYPLKTPEEGRIVRGNGRAFLFGVVAPFWTIIRGEWNWNSTTALIKGNQSSYRRKWGESAKKNKTGIPCYSAGCPLGAARKSKTILEIRAFVTTMLPLIHFILFNNLTCLIFTFQILLVHRKWQMLGSRVYCITTNTDVY